MLGVGYERVSRGLRKKWVMVDWERMGDSV